MIKVSKKFIQLALLLSISACSIGSEIDKSLLDEIRKPEKISGLYVPVIAVTYEHFNSHFKGIENYFIRIYEKDGDYFVYYTKPYTKPVMGGGSGFYRVDKTSLEIKEINFKR